MQTPEKLITVPMTCCFVVLVFQNSAPRIMTKIGITELMIPATALLISVSAIGNRNIGIKFPQAAATKRYFSCFLGNFLMFIIASGIRRTDAMAIRKLPTS